MVKSNIPLEKIERAISRASPAQQRRLLRKLPLLLKISKSDFALLKASEKSFEFWNNPEDEIYDQM